MAAYGGHSFYAQGFNRQSHQHDIGILIHQAGESFFCCAES